MTLTHKSYREDTQYSHTMLCLNLNYDLGLEPNLVEHTTSTCTYPT